MVNAQTVGYSFDFGEVQIIDLGIRPVFKKNGANPMLSDQAELIANSIAGNLETQSVCFSLMHCQSI